MKTEVRVGLIVVLAAVLFVGLLAFLGRGLLAEPGYEIRIRFTNAEGLSPGTAVRMAGVQIGTVQSLALTPDNRAEVRVRIRPGVEIARGSRFFIATSTLLGQRYLSVEPAQVGPPIDPGEVVAGEPPFSLDAIYQRIDELSADLRAVVQEVRSVVRSSQQVVDNLNLTVLGVRDVVTDPALRASLRQAATNVEAATRRLDGLVAAVGTDARQTVRNLRAVSSELVGIAEQVQTFVFDVAGDGQLAAQIRQTMISIERTARRIDEMARTLQEGLVNPDQVAEVRGIIADARTAVQKASEVLDKVSSGVDAVTGFVQGIQAAVPLLPSLRFSYGLWYDSATAFRHDLDVWVAHGQPRYYRLGLHDVGRGNYLNLQAGFRLSDTLGWRVGLIQSHIGLGLDYQIAHNWLTMLDVYNLNRLTLDLTTYYSFQPSWAISLHLRDILYDRSWGIGVQYRF
ncbi:MAG: MlaD family protein [Armatimonadota bacterium]|nr:MlaD family protein [Armatimonadota bacterium]MDR5697616.1 MlaD family protein [Armatimonadota bacterium]